MTKYNCYTRLKGVSAPWELQDIEECRSQEEADWCAQDAAFNWFEGERAVEADKIWKKWEHIFATAYPPIDEDDCEEDLVTCYYNEVISHMEFCAIAIQ